jgi:hypothetical protein
LISNWVPDVVVVISRARRSNAIRRRRVRAFGLGELGARGREARPACEGHAARSALSHTARAAARNRLVRRRGRAGFAPALEPSARIDIGAQPVSFPTPPYLEPRWLVLTFGGKLFGTT